MSDYLKRDQERLQGLHPFTRFPVHLYHASKPPIVAHSHAVEQAAREDGYTETYQHQEYPKDVPHPDGNGATVTVRSAEEEAAMPAPRKGARK